MRRGEPGRAPRCLAGGGGRDGGVPQGRALPGDTEPSRGPCPFRSTPVGADGAGRNPTPGAWEGRGGLPLRGRKRRGRATPPPSGGDAPTPASAGAAWPGPARAQPAGGGGSAGRGLPPSRGGAGQGGGAERGGKPAPGARLPAAGRSHAELREGEGGCGLGRPAAPAVAVPADGAGLQPGHPAPAALPGGQRDPLRVLGSPARPRRGAMVSRPPAGARSAGRAFSRLRRPRPLTLPVSAPQARGGRPAGQLARQQLGGQPRGHFPVPDREEPPRAVRAAPAG